MLWNKYVTLKLLVRHIVIWLRAMNIEIDCAVCCGFLAKWWVQIDAFGWEVRRNCLVGKCFAATRGDESDTGKNSTRRRIGCGSLVEAWSKCEPSI